VVLRYTNSTNSESVHADLWAGQWFKPAMFAKELLFRELLFVFYVEFIRLYHIIKKEEKVT